MSDLEQEIEMTIEDAPAKKTKVKKPRKPMSAEHKKKVLESLKKAREASKLARGKNSQAKKILKKKKNDETDEIIRRSLLEKTVKDNEKDIEIKRLKKQLDNLTLQDVIPKPKKKPKMEPIVEETEPEPEPPVVVAPVVVAPVVVAPVVVAPVVPAPKPSIKRVLRGKRVSRY